MHISRRKKKLKVGVSLGWWEFCLSFCESLCRFQGKKKIEGGRLIDLPFRKGEQIQVISVT